MKNHVGRTIGVIQVLNKQRGEGEFSQYDEELLSALATQAAVSIDNSPAVPLGDPEEHAARARRRSSSSTA